MIRHTVVFRLKSLRHSNEERDFLKAAEVLSEIPGVTNLVCSRQVNPKSPFDFCLSMEFGSQSDYQAYNEHPVHTEFVGSYWVTQVADFMELDYQSMTDASA